MTVTNIHFYVEPLLLNNDDAFDDLEEALCF